jgi:hypothetical protein
VIAGGRHEHLRLVLQPPEGLAVHDPVAISLEGGAQAAVGLFALAVGGVGASRPRGEVAFLSRPDSLGEGSRDRPRRVL